MASFAEIPPPGTPAPAPIQDWAGTDVVEVVWQNEVGGVTGYVPEHGVYVKWNPTGSGESLADEASRMRWLAPHHPVPEVLELREQPDGELLVTRAIAAHSAVRHADFDDDPDAVALAIGAGLRRLHELPTDTCPFTWSAESRIAIAEAAGRNVAPRLRAAPPIDRLVVAHGDACTPNTLVDQGAFVAHVDLARVGVADRWADLAVASMSLSWNGLARAEPAFWRGYGVEPRSEYLAYYRELWDAT